MEDMDCQRGRNQKREQGVGHKLISMMILDGK